MGLETATLAAITAATSVGTAVYSISQNMQAKKAQEKTQAAQSAANRSQQMEERRRQVREERIKRARILAASEAGGTTGSSGEAGALAGMGTQLASNIGQNLGAIALGQEISIFSQDAANASNNARTASLLGQIAPTVIGVGNSIFSDKPTPEPIWKTASGRGSKL